MSMINKMTEITESTETLTNSWTTSFWNIFSGESTQNNTVEETSTTSTTPTESTTANCESTTVNCESTTASFGEIFVVSQHNIPVRWFSTYDCAKLHQNYLVNGLIDDINLTYDLCKITINNGNPDNIKVYIRDFGSMFTFYNRFYSSVSIQKVANGSTFEYPPPPSSCESSDESGESGESEGVETTSVETASVETKTEVSMADIVTIPGMLTMIGV